MLLKAKLLKLNAHYAQAGKIQGYNVGVQGHEAAVGGVTQGVRQVAQGVQQNPGLISGATALKEGNSEFPRKAFLPGGFMCPTPMCLSPPTST